MNEDIVLKCCISYLNPTVHLFINFHQKISIKNCLDTNGLRTVEVLALTWATRLGWGQAIGITGQWAADLNTDSL